MAFIGKTLSDWADFLAGEPGFRRCRLVCRLVLTIGAKGLIPSGELTEVKRPNPITYDTDEARLGHSHQQ